MISYRYMLWKDGSWCNKDTATDYLKRTDDWIEVTGYTTPVTIADHLDDEKMTGQIIKEMLG